MLELISPWLTGNQLIERWRIDARTLWEIIIAYDLPVYNLYFDRESISGTKKISDADGGAIEMDNDFRHFDLAVRTQSWRPDEAWLSRTLDRIFFKREEIVKFEHEYGELIDKEFGKLSEPFREFKGLKKFSLPWITGKTLLDRWNIDAHELYHLITHQNLEAYNAGFERQHVIYSGPDPSENTENQNIINELGKILECDLFDVTVQEFLDSILDEIRFKREDILEFEQKNLKQS